MQILFTNLYLLQYVVSGKSKAVESDPDNRYNDAIPVFQFVSSRMEDVLKNASENGAELPLLLQCLHSFVCHVPPDIVRNAHFKRFVCIKVSEVLLL